MNKESLKLGKKFQTHCYKHDGKVHKCWDEAIYLDSTEEYNIFGNYKTLVTEVDGRTWRTREPAIEFFSKTNWFHIICQLKKDGIYYYCNIASPFVVEEKTIKYIDYDLDLRVFADGAFKILDRGEYNYHKKKMNYSSKLDTIIKKELSKLIEKAKKKSSPFKHEEIEEYYKLYKKLKGKR